MNNPNPEILNSSNNIGTIREEYRNLNRAERRELHLFVVKFTGAALIFIVGSLLLVGFVFTTFILIPLKWIFVAFVLLFIVPLQWSLAAGALIIILQAV